MAIPGLRFDISVFFLHGGVAKTRSRRHDPFRSLERRSRRSEMNQRKIYRARSDLATFMSTSPWLS
jgi:hypothetical protein